MIAVDDINMMVEIFWEEETEIVGMDDIDVMGSPVIDKIVKLSVIVVEISSDDTERDDVLTMVLEDDGEGSLSVVVLDDMKTIVDVEDDDITIKLY